MVVLVFSVMMAVVGAKESQIAGRAAIGVLRQQMVTEPISEAVSSRSAELFAAAIGTTRYLSLRSGFVHGAILYWGCLYYDGQQKKWKPSRAALRGLLSSKFALEPGVSPGKRNRTPLESSSSARCEPSCPVIPVTSARFI